MTLCVRIEAEWSFLQINTDVDVLLEKLLRVWRDSKNWFICFWCIHFLIVRAYRYFYCLNAFQSYNIAIYKKTRGSNSL